MTDQNKYNIVKCETCKVEILNDGCKYCYSGFDKPKTGIWSGKAHPRDTDKYECHTCWEGRQVIMD